MQCSDRRWGAHVGMEMLRVKGKESPATRSLRSRVFLVTPNFRDAGRRETPPPSYLMSSSSGQDPGGAMSAPWQDEEEEFKLENLKGPWRPKSRFSFTEVKALLRAVTKNRFIVLRKFNHGVTAESKKQTWMEITEEINALGENHREVRQIMKKWADLKCDGKRRMIAMRSSNSTHLRKRNLGPIEKMVHKILMMSPEDGDSDLDFGEEQKPKTPRKRRNSKPPSYLSDSTPVVDSPLSSPEKDFADVSMDFDEMEPYSEPEPDDDPSLRVKPVHTYTRNGGPSTPPGPSTSSGFLSELDAASSSTSAPPSQSPASSILAAPSALNSTQKPALSSFAPVRPGAGSEQASSSRQPCTSRSVKADPLPSVGHSVRPNQQVAQLAAQSLQQQQASRALLSSVSQSLEILAQSVQLLVETQQEFVQESLLLQRETVDVLRDFSNTALTMLREKANSAPVVIRQRPAF
ncbi:uncharacterized protein ACB058_009719 isoform 2-T2 [Synchiropus picturatus]